MVKRFIIAVVLIAIVCGGLVGFNLFRAQMIDQFFANMPVQTVTVSATEAQPTTWTPGIDAIGTIVARQGVDVAAETGGVVKEIAFSANQHVEAGAVLVQIDDAIEQANLIAANAAVTRDQQALDRAQQLTKRGIASAADLETAQASLDASRSQLESLQATLDQKSIKAPFAGTIGIPKIDVGQYLTAGTAVATLQDLDTMKVDFTVPEQRLPEIEIGQPVKLGLSADVMPYAGKITGIDPKIDPSSRLVAVQAEVDNSDGRLRPGQFAHVRVVLPSEEDIITLPQTAVITSLYGSYVYVVKEKPPEEGASAEGEKAEPTLAVSQVFVTTGRRSGASIEIVKGVAAGDRVVTAGQNRLSNGSVVAVDNTVDPANMTAEGARP